MPLVWNLADWLATPRCSSIRSGRIASQRIFGLRPAAHQRRRSGGCWVGRHSTEPLGFNLRKPFNRPLCGATQAGVFTAQAHAALGGAQDVRCWDAGMALLGFSSNQPLPTFPMTHAETRRHWRLTYLAGHQYYHFPPTAPASR